MIWTPLLATVASYLLTTIVYRLFLHPLSRFPGPKRAAVSLLYEFYHDAIRGGQYCFKIKEMHDKYGPIIRISPTELHVSDPAFIKELYAGGTRKRNRTPQAVNQFGVPQSTGGSLEHDVHRMRRASLSDFFSTASIAKIEPLIVRHVSVLCDQIEILAIKGQPVRLSSAFSCLTASIAHEFAFSKSPNFLLNPDFETPFGRAFAASFVWTGFVKHTPWFFTLMDSISELPFFKPSSDLGWFAQWRKEIRADIREHKRKVQGEKTSHSQRMDVFETILRSDLPSEEKATWRLAQEASLIIAAGTETTAWVQSVIIFHLLSNRQVLGKLLEELNGAMADKSSLPPVHQLEQLPYLISSILAVVSEGLRLGIGVCSRLARVAPTETMILKTSSRHGGEVVWEIPAGTPVSMTAWLIHMNPELFPDPDLFRPERWIENRRLDRYLLSFSKGSRQCLGINLAYAEVYIGVGAIVRQFGERMSLHNTTKDNVEFARDYFVPYPKEERRVEVTVDLAR